MAKYLAVFSGGHVPECKPDGTFKVVQCYRGECWCVDETTGDELKGTRVMDRDRLNCDCE